MGNNFEEVNCNLCGKNDYKVVFKGELKGEGAVQKNAYSAASTQIVNDQIVKCNECGLIYINPRLKAKDIVEGYSSAVDEAYVSQAEGRIQSFRKSMEEIEKTYGKKGKILDVGCAAGFFLAAAKEKGWECRGVEPSKWLGEWGSKKFGIKIDQGVLEEQNYPAKSFDVVTLWDVLEHVPDPSKTLAECKRVLKDDGILVLNYPNIGSSLAKIAGKRWWFLLSVHLTYFVPETIKKMLERQGFDLVKSKRHYGRLSIGYLVGRFKPYSKAVYAFLNKITSTLGLNDKQISYYASQTRVYARKKR